MHHSFRQKNILLSKEFTPASVTKYFSYQNYLRFLIYPQTEFSAPSPIFYHFPPFYSWLFTTFAPINQQINHE